MNVITYQISSLLDSIKNNNKYNFEEKDIPNPRPNKYTSSTFMFVMWKHYSSFHIKMGINIFYGVKFIKKLFSNEY